MLAHINPQEAALLKARGGSGTINPRTGLREFFTPGQFAGFAPIAPAPEPTLGQALDPKSLANLATKLNEVTVPSQGSIMGFNKPETQKISDEYSNYVDRSAPLGMGGGRQVQGYTIPVEQTFAGKPLVAQYDAQGNFKQLTLQPGEYLTPDPSRPNIVSVPKINEKGQIVDYGVFDITKQDSGSFASFLGGLASDFGPMLLAGLGANLFGGMNLLGGAGAVEGATAANALGGAIGGGSTELLSFLTPAEIAGSTSGFIPELITPTAESYGGVLGSGSTALTGGSLTDLGAVTGGTSLADLGAPTAESYGGVLGGGSTALTGGVTPEIIGGITASDIGSLADLGAPTAESYGGVLGGGSTALTGGVAPEVGDITASNIGVVPTGVPGGGGGSGGGGGGGGAVGGLTSGAGSTLGGIASGFNPAGSIAGGIASQIASGLLGADAAKSAAQTQADAATRAAQIQQEMFNTINAQGIPYRGAGYSALNQIRSMLPGEYTQYDEYGRPIGTGTGSGYLTQQFGPQQFAQGMDPGYAFRLQQGQMANQRSSNLAGGLIGGNALQGMQDYSQGMASQEYNNAFNRFQTQRGNIYNTLAGIAGIGQTAQGQANTLAQNNATAQGQLLVGSAAAQAAGRIGQAAGYGGALTNAANNYFLSQLLNQNQNAAGSNLSGSNFMDAYNAIG